MSTFLHGVGTVQFIDKSSELVDLKGLDISSLAKTGVINYEHKSDVPAQLVGKILKAKKIFAQADCANEHELHFWNKVKVPYLYIMAELLDDYCDSAKHVAGILRYDRDRKDQNEYAIAWFSVEGSEIPNSRGNNKMVVARGIARKVTLTSMPCNNGCAAEILENQKPQVKDDFEEIFKSEAIAVEMLKTEAGLKMYGDFLAKKEVDPKGKKIGLTKSNKDIFSHKSPKEYEFGPDEHKEAAEYHRHAAVTAEDQDMIDHHIEQMKAHNRASLKKSEKLCKKHLKKDSMMSSPPEPNPANASAMQSGAMSGATPFGQAITNIKESLGFGKSETSGWSRGSAQGNAVHFNHPEHGSVSVVKQPSGEIHVMHQGKLAGVGGAKGVFGNMHDAGIHAKKYMSAVSQKKILPAKMHNISSSGVLNHPINKAIEAGSYNAAPSTLTNGAAYQVESMSPGQAKTGAEDHNFQATPKQNWKKRAKDEYERWPNKEKFEKFMQARMPHLKLGEIRAIGRALALKKNLDMEKSLEGLVMSKSDAGKELDQKSLKDIQIETAKKWCGRAEEAYNRAINEKSIKWLLDAISYGDEAIEHAGMSEEIGLFEEVRGKILPLHAKALELLVPKS